MKKSQHFHIKLLLLLAGLAGCAGQGAWIKRKARSILCLVSSIGGNGTASKVIDRSPPERSHHQPKQSCRNRRRLNSRKKKQKNRSCRKHQTRRSLPHLCRKAPPRRSLLRRKRRSLQNRRKPNLLRPLRQKNRSRASHRRKVHRLKNPRVPDFNIQTWIDHAKTYAVSVGLQAGKFGGRLLGQSHHSQCAQPVLGTGY